MNVMSRRSSERAADAPIVAPEQLLALFAAKDLDALIDTAFDVLHTAVVCDFVTAFYRSSGNGLMKERDSLGRESAPAFMRRYMELTPALPIAMASPGIKILATRTILPPIAELQRTVFYREIMQPQGWRHAVALCFWGDPPGASPLFVTTTCRREGRSDFSPQESARLERVHRFLDCAVNRLNEREAAKTVREGMAIAVRDGTRGFAILDHNLLLVQANPIGRLRCAAWVDHRDVTTPARPRAWQLPTVLAAACRELRHEWQTSVRADPDAIGNLRRQVLHPRVPGVTASVTMVWPNTTGMAEPTFVLELDGRVNGIALETPDRSMPVLQQMTASERAVAMVLADGFSNQEIADQLGKTVYAVKFLLHRIYRKTGVPSRAALVAVLRSRPRRARKRAKPRIRRGD
jgi:DNA-binding CsgD family transcriptional regulator